MHTSTSIEKITGMVNIICGALGNQYRTFQLLKILFQICIKQKIIKNNNKENNSFLLYTIRNPEFC